MSRKTVALTVDRLAGLPDAGAHHCRSCVFWELDPVRRGRLDAGGCVAEKEAWVSSVLRDWGSCGRIAVVDDQTVGYLIYAPPAFVPGADTFPTAPVSADAVVMTTAYVDPAFRGGGIGRLLIQGMARDLIKRGGIRAVECFADPRGRSAHCVVPQGFCERVGFKTQRAHGTSPRMRMELRSALTWKDEVELALEKLLGAVRPVAQPKASPPGAHRIR
jgi:GNAT superfamily N-acetyltransferase